LPIPHQPSVIRKALAAGKHVLSEKPIAGNVVDGQELLEWYSRLGERKPVWGVAENFRFMESLAYAAQKVKEIGGLLRTFRLEKYGFVGVDDKYFNTECMCIDRRRAPGQFARFPSPFPGQDKKDPN